MTNDPYQLALHHHQAGRLADAEAFYRQVLATNPQHAEAHNNLGAALQSQGRLDEGIACYRRAAEIQPSSAGFHDNLGAALQARGQFDQAITAHRRAIALAPNSAEFHAHLATALQSTGQLEPAIAAYRQALTLRPDLAEAHNNLGLALAACNRWQDAATSFRQALAQNPRDAVAHFNLGNVQKAMGQIDAAIVSFRQALTIHPAYVDAHNNLGLAFADQGQLEAAITSYRQALALQPDFAAAINNLGVALHATGRLGEAITSFRQALALQPNYVEALINLGVVLQFAGQLDESAASMERALALRPNDSHATLRLANTLLSQGRLDEALDRYRQALASAPTDAAARSSYLYALHFHPASTTASLFQEHQEWQRHHAAPLAREIPRLTNDRTPDRRLKIGYVSPDFRGHVVGRFMQPLLAAHDHRQFEIFCYASVSAPDAFTAQLRGHADVWRDVLGLSDAQLANQIRQDNIDILVDLSMHMAGNRLLTFARKPAPVQVTYLAYCSTTGLDAIDYRLTDPHLDPPGLDDQHYSERSIRLPQSYWCYPSPPPGVATPEVAALPALKNGFITFGCLNNFYKITPPTLETWRELLHSLPESRLLLHAHEGSHRHRLTHWLEERGIAPHRIEFAGMMPPAQYFQRYAQIDIALDPFPYCGGTTSCDALWMGVPIITLAGRTAVGRGGGSILTNLGLTELIARSQPEYVQIATTLARDLPRLSQLRSSLRQRIQQSPLMDAPNFARAIESAYRQMWRQYCSSPATPGAPDGNPEHPHPP